MANLIEGFPTDTSVTHLFSRENLAFERQQTTLGLAHLALSAAKMRTFGNALLGSACTEDGLREIARRAEAALREDGSETRGTAEVSLHDSLRDLLQTAVREAQQWGAAKVNVDHLVLSLLHGDDFCNRFLPLDERQWLQAGSETRQRLKSRKRTIITHTPTLDLHSVDLTRQMCVGGAPWPICGRDAELVQLRRVLLRRTKRNPLLVGPAGAGKSTLLLGLAAAFLEHPIFASHRLCELDLSSLIAGTIYRGELEARMKRILKELHENPTVHVAIDEAHLLQTGGSESSANCAEFFKPALARGEICVIGATCPEHLPLLFRDTAIERRFEPIFIEPLDAAAVRQVLLCVRDSLKAYYADWLGARVEIGDEILEAIPLLALETLPGRAEPDASITILQDAIATALASERYQESAFDQETVRVSHAELEEVAKSLSRTAKLLAKSDRAQRRQNGPARTRRKRVRSETPTREPC